MNNDDEDPLENLLAALKPAALPPQLRARLQRPRARRPWAWTAALGAPLAAAACWWLMAPASEPETAPAGGADSQCRVFVSVERTRRLMAVHDLPVINPGSPHPTALRVVQWVNDTTYVSAKGPRTLLRRQQPETQVIPVSFETF